MQSAKCKIAIEFVEAGNLYPLNFVGGFVGRLTVDTDRRGRRSLQVNNLVCTVFVGRRGYGFAITPLSALQTSPLSGESRSSLQVPRRTEYEPL